MTDQPPAGMDPVERLRVLAAALNGSTYYEAPLPAPASQVWDFVSDMDTAVPVLFPNFRSWHTVAEEPHRRRASAVGHLGVRSMFDVRLDPGFCLMQDRIFLGGLAACSRPDGSRFAVLVAPRGSARVLGVVLRPILRKLLRRSISRLHERVGPG